MTSAERFVLPASSGEERLWFLDRLEPGGCVYNQPSAFRIVGPLNRGALEASLNEIVRRHETLRTSFATEDGVVVQHVHAHLQCSLPVVDLSAVEHREAELRRRLDAASREPFDLAQAPLFRVRLYALAADEHVFAVTFHHIIADGWSEFVFLRELHALYEAFDRGQPSPLAELPIQYADYAAWQREQLTGQELERQRAYWKKQLANVPTLDLPTDRPRPKLQSYRGRQRLFVVPPALTAALKALGLRHRATLFMVTAAAFKVLLHRYTTQVDVTIGFVVAGRARSELEGLIGFFANTLVLRTDLSGNPTFVELLARLRESTLGAFSHEELPFEKVVEEARIERDMSRSPLFQVLFSHMPPTTASTLGQLPLTPVPVDAATSKFDLSVNLGEVGSQVEGFIEYNTDLFDATTIERLLGHYETLLEGVVAAPQTRLAELPLLTEPERQRILHTWNETRVDDPNEQTIVQLFEAQTKRSPQAVAVVYEDTSLTYEALNTRADALAAYLRTLGVRPGALVGVYVERSLELMVGLLATLKAGGAYVPLDPAYPADRRAFMLEDSQASVLLTQTKLDPLACPPGVQVVHLDKLPALRAPRERLVPSASADDLAYVLYTSGSTGKPKGVEIRHRALTNLLLVTRAVSGCTESDAFLAITTISFDISVMEIFMPLICGARVLLANRTVAADGRLLREKIERSRPTLLQGTPPTWRMLLDAGWKGTPGLTAFTGGEALSPDLAQMLLERTSTLWNLYGPTETTVWSSGKKIANTVEEITIGRPIANTTFYILDQRLQPVPIGVPGELFIGGDGLARGYRGRPELTAEKFIPHPFVSEPGARVYRTGDLARYRADGQVVHVGRLDHQVKIRGFRIECGEIEAVLATAPGVGRCVVVARPDHSGALALVAYIVNTQGAEARPAELRKQLRQKLPDYMVPQYFVSLDALPLTPSGKIDRKRLPAPERDVKAGSEFTSPRTPTETRVAAIFADVLQVSPIGAHSDFFEAGGQSMTAIRLLAKLETAFKVSLPLQTLFETPTVASLSNRICDLTGAARAVVASADGGARGREPSSHTERQLAAIWRRVLGVADVGVDEDFLKLQGARDLLGAMLAEVRRTFFTRAEGLPVHAFLEEPTIGALARIIDGSAERSSSLLVCLQPAGEKRPVFLIHAGGGYVFFYRALAATLGRGRPIYAIRAATRSDRPGPPYEQSESVEAIARRYIAEIRAVQPNGPYTLGGACFGGVAALEMARQLQAQGEQICGPLLLFDAFLRRRVSNEPDDPPAASYATHRALMHLRRSSNLGAGAALWYLVRKVVSNIPTALSLAPALVRQTWHKFKFSDAGIGMSRAAGRALNSTAMLHRAQQRLSQRYLDATSRLLGRYRPGQFDGRIVLFKAQVGKDPEPAWIGLARDGMAVHTLPGEHLDMMEEPTVAQTAGLVASYLNALAD